MKIYMYFLTLERVIVKYYLSLYIRSQEMTEWLSKVIQKKKFCFVGTLAFFQRIRNQRQTRFLIPIPHTHLIPNAHKTAQKNKKTVFHKVNVKNDIPFPV
jgi:hypothetical protein